MPQPPFESNAGSTTPQRETMIVLRCGCWYRCSCWAKLVGYAACSFVVAFCFALATYEQLLGKPQTSASTAAAALLGLACFMWIIEFLLTSCAVFTALLIERSYLAPTLWKIAKIFLGTVLGTAAGVGLIFAVSLLTTWR